MEDSIYMENIYGILCILIAFITKWREAKYDLREDYKYWRLQNSWIHIFAPYVPLIQGQREQRAETEKQTNVWKSLGITIKGLLYIMKAESQLLQIIVDYQTKYSIVLKSYKTL